MRIKIGGFEFTEVWDGVLYKNLSHYPAITDWEKRTLIEFLEYEQANGRNCFIECENEQTLADIRSAMENRERYRKVSRPPLLTECTACRHGGCLTDYVCHTTSPENALAILKCGSLLSAVKARNLPAQTLMGERRNAACDPADYFDYVMLSWGNCQAGDRLVMERKLGRFPDEADLSRNFTPGVRFYFRYDDLIRHPQAVFDGVLPVKIRHELVLADYLYAMVIPEELRLTLEPVIPEGLSRRVIYTSNDCRDIWEWSEKVYHLVAGRDLHNI